MAVARATLAIFLAMACGPVAREPTSAARVDVPAPSVPPTLQRGMNLGNALDAPTEGDWGVTLDASDFDSVRAAGFDHVRLPVRFSAHASSSGEVDADFLARVDWAVDQALSRGLSIVIDFHHYEEIMKEPDENAARFVAIWKNVAAHFAKRPPHVYFELLNEPNGALTEAKWNAMIPPALAAVRATNPTRKVILEGVFWASAKNLRDTLVIPKDANLVGSFHMYQPILFTHQGASWMPPEYATKGVVFPGPPARRVQPAPATADVAWARDWFARFNGEPESTNPCGAATIASELDIAKGFADRTGLEVYMGEFGVMDTADDRSRQAWLRLVRVEAEKRHFGWAYWDDGGAFAIYDRKSHAWKTALEAALLP